MPRLWFVVVACVLAVALGHVTEYSDAEDFLEVSTVLQTPVKLVDGDANFQDETHTITGTFVNRIADNFETGKYEHQVFIVPTTSSDNSHVRLDVTPEQLGEANVLSGDVVRVRGVFLSDEKSEKNSKFSENKEEKVKISSPKMKIHKIEKLSKVN